MLWQRPTDRDVPVRSCTRQRVTFAIIAELDKHVDLLRQLELELVHNSQKTFQHSFAGWPEARRVVEEAAGAKEGSACCGAVAV